MRRHHNQFISSERERNSKLLLGIAVITFGILFLLERQGMPFPEWVISWKTIMITGGLISLYKHKFRLFFSWVVVGVGVAFLIEDFYPSALDRQLILPVLVIAFGVHLVLKHTSLLGKKKPGEHETTLFDEARDLSSEDYIRSSTIFGGVTKNVVSKTFKGAQLTTVFGGTEINLMKADIEGPISINTRTVFGGVTLIVPANWQIHSHVTTIAGSVEDQRAFSSDVQFESSKLVSLKGTCLFGGVEIRTY